MKITKPLLLAFFLCCTTTLFGEEVPPTLSFVKAAQIAQEALEKQNLSKEYFIRSLFLVRTTDETPTETYNAYFEPTQKVRMKVDTETPPVPIKVKVIVISMDGAATIEEKVIEQSESSRRVIRRKLMPSTEEQQQ